MRLISSSLTTATTSPQDIGARGNMLVGSCLAGISFMKGLGMVHAVSHMVGANYDTHHGLTNAILLPAVLRFNRDAIGSRIRPMCEALGLENHSYDDFYRHVCELLDTLEIPESLGKIGVGHSRVLELAEKSSQDAGASTNPRTASVQEIADLIAESIDRAR